MGKIKVHEFTTLDGVVDAPMWTMDYEFTDELGDAIGSMMAGCTAILLGRTTFEGFASSWPQRSAAEDPGAPFFNDTPKYVVSSTLEQPEWGPTTLLGGYDAGRIARLKQEVDGDLYVSGSRRLVAAMLQDGLVDELHLFVYPVFVQEGVRLFDAGAPQLPLTLLSSRGLGNDVVHLAYGPASG